MKLWHDDRRPPPDDSWVWAKDNPAARNLLANRSISEASLDCDLGFCEPFETGEDLARWMVETGHIPPKVTIHSFTPAGMQRILAGHCAELIVEADLR